MGSMLPNGVAIIVCRIVDFRLGTCSVPYRISGAAISGLQRDNTRQPHSAPPTMIAPND